MVAVVVNQLVMTETQQMVQKMVEKVVARSRWETGGQKVKDFFAETL